MDNKVRFECGSRGELGGGEQKEGKIETAVIEQ